MTEAYIIDACRTPRGIGKVGKGALANMHPQHLASTVLKALAERNNINTAEVDDVIWGTSTQVGMQGADMGRMAALDAGYDIKASGMTLDRFCGSGITTVNLAAATIMSGMQDCVIAGGCEMMSYTAQLPQVGPIGMDKGNLHLRAIHPQSHQGVCADAIASMEGITREAVDALALESQKRAAVAIAEGRFDKSLVPVYDRDGTLLLAKEEFPRPQTTAEGLAALKPSFTQIADMPLDEQGTTGRKDRAHPPRRQLVRRRGRRGRAAALLAGLRQEAGLETAGEDHLVDQHGRLPHPDAERAGPRCEEGAGTGGPDGGRHRSLGNQRGLRRRRREVHPRPEARPREGERERRRHGARPPHRRDRLAADRHDPGRT